MASNPWLCVPEWGLSSRNRHFLTAGTESALFVTGSLGPPEHSWDLATGPQIFAGWLNLVVHLLSSLGTGTHLPMHLYLISLSSKPSGRGRSWERGNMWFSTVSMTSSSGDWHGLDSPGVVYAQ